ncbi:pantoate--beta-alanine ligase [Paenibacillus crassostreae]|uniref:Pantothenate synthetase n=1 Tax=Paenibacillus crassostreae TaxID=1763538 RepID=A0A167DLH3_9BACL|nr:pantoate--beta-alanine ligase [Paenibacillus crassostreae]AOZ91314.1 pantoate--beta-alanine ligase [Paenibacillus crassostreae]OAB74528.1 pantoate--beta-alanine ligase [Paenibacillus crassostreae]
MKVIRSISELKHELQQYRVSSQHNAKIGLVPTMGFLHNGHASLMTRAREFADVVVVSIFVNPIQFGPGEDYETYPRNEERDLALAEKQGVDIVFIPTVAEMYPQPTKTKIRVSERTDRLCGASRPGHFDGVTTVVSKLINIVQPQFAFFGQKDAQQVAVLQQMVMDLNINVEIVPCPIVREEDGLALSSRNVYLNTEERKQALVLSRSLRDAEVAFNDSKSVTASELREKILSMIQSSPLAKIDYIEVLTFPELIPVADNAIVTEVESQIIIALAVKFGTTRLIDNMLFMPKGAFSIV